MEREKDWLPDDLYRQVCANVPIACADTVVICGRHVLVLERIIEPAWGSWALPGGHIRKGEQPVAAARRELHEETGLRVPKDAFVFVGVETYDHGWRYDITLTFCVALPDCPDVKLNDEHGSVLWAPVDELPVGLLVPARRVIVKAFEERYESA